MHGPWLELELERNMLPLQRNVTETTTPSDG
jgi:hypothetical protein